MVIGWVNLDRPFVPVAPEDNESEDSSAHGTENLKTQVAEPFAKKIRTTTNTATSFQEKLRTPDNAHEDDEEGQEDDEDDDEDDDELPKSTVDQVRLEPMVKRYMKSLLVNGNHMSGAEHCCGAFSSRASFFIRFSSTADSYGLPSSISS